MSVLAVPYIKWSNAEEGIEYVGVLTRETETHISILTKHGEMTVPKTDGEFTPTTREEFEQVPSEPTTELKPVDKAKKKQHRAHVIVSRMIAENKTRQEILNELVKELNITSLNAGVYYSKCTK